MQYDKFLNITEKILLIVRKNPPKSCNEIHMTAKSISAENSKYVEMKVCYTVNYTESIINKMMYTFYCSIFTIVQCCLLYHLWSKTHQ